MRPSRLALAAIFALVGLVWIGQGVGAIGGSDLSLVVTGMVLPFWAVVGAILVVVAVAIVVLERRRAGG